MKRNSWLAMLAAAAWISGCGGASEVADAPHIVLITLDTTRADHIGAFGAADARTPALDALAARGVAFDRAYSSVPLTLPAHTSILTGLGPHQHGVHDNGRFEVAPSLETVAEQLAASGYDTAAFVSAFVLDASFGLDQGFEVYDDEIDDLREPLSFAVSSRAGGPTTDRALAWLGAGRERPFFLWVHYYDPHQTLDAPAPFDAIEDPYAAEIAYMDAQIARLLEGVEAASGERPVLVVAVGDHGESLGEHGEPTHGVVAYDSTLRVPLIAAGPGFEPGRRSQAFVRIEDVAPTLLGAAGLSPDREGDALPLSNLLDEAAAGERLSYFESRGPSYALGWAPIAGVRSARWKLTAEPDPAELYDLLEDPGETRNLAEEQWQVTARLAEAYGERRPEDERTAAAEIDEAVQERLAQLGYLSAPLAEPTGPAPDPRTAVGALKFVFAADRLARDGELPRAVQALGILVQSPVVRTLALDHLGRTLLQAGRPREAVDSFERLVSETGSPSARVELARALVADARPAEALEALAPLEGDGFAEPPSVTLMRAQALTALDRPDDAEAALAGLLEREPNHERALAQRSRARAARDGAGAEIARLREHFDAGREGVELRGVLAELLLEAGRLDEARAALEVGSPPPGQRWQLAQIAEASGDLAGAIALYEGLVAEFPAMFEVRRELAELYGKAERVEDELQLYGQLIELDPRDAGMLVDRGTALSRAGRRDEALRDFRAAAIADPKLPEAAFNTGLLLLEGGEEEGAESQLQRAVELRPDYAKAHFHLARLYRKRGDPRAATHAERATQTPAAVSSGPEVPPQ